MNAISIGIITHFSPDPQAALEKVKGLGLSHVQVGYPENWDTPEGHAAILAAAESTGIEITTVFCGFAGESYADIPTVRRQNGLVPLATRAERVAKVGQIAAFARAIKVNRVAAHIGYVPEEAGPARDDLRDVVRGICDDLAQHGQVFALETGQETAAGLLAFLKDVARPNIKVNFDPANMILYGNDKPIPATELLFPYIDGVHCKDGDWPTEKDKLGKEKPWGQGSVDAKTWIQTLQRLGYDGPYTIEREISGEQQVKDVLAARELLVEWLGADK